MKSKFKPTGILNCPPNYPKNENMKGTNKNHKNNSKAQGEIIFR